MDIFRWHNYAKEKAMRAVFLLSVFALCVVRLPWVCAGTAENPEDGDKLIRIVSMNDEIVTVSDLYSYSGPHCTGERMTHLAKGDASDDVHIAPYGTKHFYLGQCRSYTISFMYKSKEIEMDTTFDEHLSRRSRAGWESNFAGLFAVDYDVSDRDELLPPVGAPQIVLGDGHIVGAEYEWITFYDTTATGGMIDRDAEGNPISPPLPDMTTVTPVFEYDVVVSEVTGVDCPEADLTGDCSVDFKDFALMASQWLAGALPIPDGMVRILGGTFEMGDNLGDGWPNELPVHRVYLDFFMMSRFEVTNRQYCDFLNSTLSSGRIEVHDGTVYAVGDDHPYCDTKEAGSESRIIFTGIEFSVEANKQNHPMVMVSWFGAVAFCNWRSEQEGFEACYDLQTWTCDFTKTGFRLATEAEWEYAARGGLSGKRYPWGDSIVPSQANYRDTDGPYATGDYPWTTPVGFYDGRLRQKADFNWPGSQPSYQTTSGVNGYGLSDMAGNVREMCNDQYHLNYYESSPAVDPKGPAGRLYRVIRGAYWTLSETRCRVSYRNYLTPSSRSDGIGFRLVLDPN